MSIGRHFPGKAARLARAGAKIAAIVVLMVISLELALHLFPLPNPYASSHGSASSRVHKFLPGWNAYGGWFGELPPFATTFITGRLHGVSTTSVLFKVNCFGFPYAEEKGTRGSSKELRVGVIGGSTVECAALAEGKRWPDVLGRFMAEQISNRPVIALNFGVSGQDTRTHLATTAEHAVKLDLDYLVFMLGANDLFRAGLHVDPLEADDAFLLQKECDCLKAFLMNFQLVRRVRVLYHRLRGTEYYVASESGDRPYFAAQIGEKLRFPVLQTAKKEISADMLRDYEKNILSLSALATAHGIVPIFTTQPMLWKPVMSEEEEAVDWLAGTVVSDGRTYRIPPAEQARSLETLNSQLLDTCAKFHLGCVDLDKAIPHTLEFFYELGASERGRR